MSLSSYEPLHRDFVARHLHARYAALLQAPAYAFAGSSDRNPSASEAEGTVAMAAAYLDAFDVSLGSAYGWSAMDHRLAVDRSRRHLLVHVSSALPLLRRRLIAGLRSAIPAPWRLTMTSAHDAPDQSASLCDNVTTVWRECHAKPRTTSTEYLRVDGPVRILGRARGLTLIRGADGTTGWTADALMPLGSRPRPTERPSVHAPDRTPIIRSYLGVPYRIGGTTGDGIDCSGLTQRLVRDLTGQLIPRHTTDQLGFYARSAARAPVEAGDLVFLQFEDLVWHVGVAVQARDGSWSVINASSVADRVVEHSLDEFLGAGIRSRIGRITRK